MTSHVMCCPLESKQGFTHNVLKKCLWYPAMGWWVITGKTSLLSFSLHQAREMTLFSGRLPNISLETRFNNDQLTLEKAFIFLWSSLCGAAEMNPTRNHEVVGSIPDLAQWVKDLGVAVSCGEGQQQQL